ncbi:MAG: hypothetical protein ACRDRY_16595 [Pseudonocardiaceae bacterium]
MNTDSQVAAASSTNCIAVAARFAHCAVDDGAASNCSSSGPWMVMPLSTVTSSSTSFAVTHRNRSTPHLVPRPSATPLTSDKTLSGAAEANTRPCMNEYAARAISGVRIAIMASTAFTHTCPRIATDEITCRTRTALRVRDAIRNCGTVTVVVLIRGSFLGRSHSSVDPSVTGGYPGRRQAADGSRAAPGGAGRNDRVLPAV